MFIDALDDYQNMGGDRFEESYPYLLDVLQHEGLLDRFSELSELYADAEDFLGGPLDFHAGNLGVDNVGKLKFLNW